MGIIRDRERRIVVAACTQDFKRLMDGEKLLAGIGKALTVAMELGQ